MSIEGRRNRISWIAAIAAIVLAGGLVAAKVKGSAVLGTGGFTLGGPATVALAPASGRTLFEPLGPGVLRDLCVTVTDVRGNVELNLLNTAGGSFGRSVDPGTAVTYCAGDVGSVNVTCLGSDACQLSWRVDLLPAS